MKHNKLISEDIGSLSKYCDPYRSEACMCRVSVMKRVQDPCIGCLYKGSSKCLVPEEEYLEVC